MASKEISRTTSVIRGDLESKLDKSDYESLYSVATKVTNPDLGLQGRLAAIAEAIATNVGARKAFVYVPEPNTAHGRFEVTTKEVYDVVDANSTQPLLKRKFDISDLVAMAHNGPKDAMLLPFDLGRDNNGLIYVTDRRDGKFDIHDLAWISALQPIITNSVNEKSAVGTFGLHDRAHLFERMEDDILTAFKNGFSYVFLLIDGDNFKPYNEVWDYATGDKILQVISDSMLASTRGTDVCARYGGDEFAVFLPETEFDKGIELAHSLRSSVENTDLGLYYRVGVLYDGESKVQVVDLKYMRPEQKKDLRFEPLTIAQYRADKPELKKYVIKKAAKTSEFEAEDGKEVYVGRQRLTVSIGVAHKPGNLAVNSYLSPLYTKRDKSGNMMLNVFLTKNRQYLPYFEGVNIAPDNVDAVSSVMADNLRVAASYARFCIIDEANAKLQRSKEEGRNRIVW